MRTSPIALPAVLFGVGLGGFFDGIVLHQILQWHHLVSERVPPTTLEGIRVNMTADGLFHAGTWLVTVVALVALWRARRAAAEPLPGRTLGGGLLAGWGGFNVVEGLVDHQLLGLHHVRPGPDEVLWDLAFLAWGALMAIVGAALLSRRGTPGPATGSGGPRSRASR